MIPRDYEQSDRELRFERRRGYQPHSGVVLWAIFLGLGGWTAICLFVGYAIGVAQ